MSDAFRGFIEQKSAQLQLVVSALNELLQANLQDVGTFTDRQQKICWGIFEAAGVVKISLGGLQELVKMARDSCFPAIPTETSAGAGSTQLAEDEDAMEETTSTDG